MSVHQLLQDLADALGAMLDLDDGIGEVEPWDCFAAFQLDEPDSAMWADTAAAENPPRTYPLLKRTDSGDTVVELWWELEGRPMEEWPVVAISDAGDCQVIALNAYDWLDALLLTNGVSGGGAEEDLDEAIAESTHEGRRLSDDLRDELDRNGRDLLGLAERWEEAQDEFSDAWSDAVEGIEA